MKTSVEPLEGNKVRVSVEVDEAEFEKAIDEAFRRIAREVRIPGFRPGKAPRKILEARVGSGVAREEALREALPGYYAQAVRDHDVDVIAAPEIDITGGQETGPIAFDAVVEVRPQISVGGYDALRVTIPAPVATEEEIDAQVERLRSQFGELEVVDRAVQTGDFVTIDIKGSQDGEQIDGLTADDYLYEVGTGSIVPELDDQLTGTKVGAILDFEAEHPDPDEDEIDFRVLVKEVKVKILPEVDDEWANEASEFETVAELRDDLAKRMSTIKIMRAQMALRDKTAEALAELVDVDVPEALVNTEMQQRLQDLGLRLQAQGISLEQYLTASGRPQEEIIAELRETAIPAVKVDLALRAVAEAEAIECEEEDLAREYASIAARVDETPERVREEFERGEQVAAVRSDVRKRKALEWLLERVEVVDDDGNPIDRAELELPEDDEGEPAEGPAEASDEGPSDTASDSDPTQSDDSPANDQHPQKDAE